MLVHSDKKPFQCAVCGNTYSQPTNLRTHVKNAHNYSVGMNKDNKCEYCGHAQNSLVGLHHHLLGDHKNQVQKQMNIYLNRPKASKLNLNRGEYYKRKKTPVEHNRTEIQILEKELKEEKEPLQTELIDNVPCQQTVLKEPQISEVKHSPPPKQSEEANQLQLDDGLGKGEDWDIATSQDRFFICEQCQQMFNWRFEILFHMLSHLRDERGDAMNRSCPQCETTFKTAVGLKQHIISHTEELPFM